MSKTLIIDNNIDRPWRLCGDFRRYLDGEIHVRRAPQEDLPSDPRQYSHVIFSGSKTEAMDTSPWVDKLLDLIRECERAGTPMLGVCFGHQMIARAYGGLSSVGKAVRGEVGWVRIQQTAPNPVLEGLPKTFYTFESHFDEVTRLPGVFELTATSEHCAVQAYAMKGKPVFGIQFHPEKNAAEGQASIDSRRKILPKDCLFNDGKADSVFNENVARTIFRNFLARRR